MGYHGVRKKDVKEDLFGTGTTEAYQNIASGFYPHLSRRTQTLMKGRCSHLVLG